MRCPFCNENDSKVLDSRPTEEGEKIRRRRECTGCNKRFTTYEIVETLPIMVTKKDDSIETFDKRKIIGGILKSCEKRPVTLEQVESLVTSIENELLNKLVKEISSINIGTIVMEKLKKLDEVAYVRFASVYRQFSDVESFMDEMKKVFNKK
ncbi:MAG: transcriptional regulator NrdR [Oscillospiraceae bacterium]